MSLEKKLIKLINQGKPHRDVIVRGESDSLFSKLKKWSPFSFIKLSWVNHIKIKMDEIYIEKIGLSDLKKVEAIAVTMDQSSFVSPPAQTLALISELGYEEKSLPFRIAVNSVTIGFFTLNFFCPIQSQADEEYYGGERTCRIESFMIDKKYQRHRFGLRAFREIVALLKNDFPHINELKLSVNFRNEAAKSFYRKCGLSNMGKVYHGGSSGPQHIYLMELI